MQIVTTFYRIHSFVTWTCTTKARLTHTLTHRFPTDVSGDKCLNFQYCILCLFLRESRACTHFVDLDIPIPRSQEFSAFAYQEPHQSIPRHSNWISLILFNIILPCRRTSSWWCIFITLFNHSPLCIQNKNLTAARFSMLKSRASLTCFRACFLSGQAKDLSALLYFFPPYVLCSMRNSSFLTWSPGLFGEKNKSWSSSLCNYLQSPVTSDRVVKQQANL